MRVCRLARCNPPAGCLSVVMRAMRQHLRHLIPLLRRRSPHPSKEAARHVEATVGSPTGVVFERVSEGGSPPSSQDKINLKSHVVLTWYCFVSDNGVRWHSVSAQGREFQSEQGDWTFTSGHLHIQLQTILPHQTSASDTNQHPSKNEVPRLRSSITRTRTYSKVTLLRCRRSQRQCPILRRDVCQ